MVPHSRPLVTASLAAACAVAFAGQTMLSHTALEDLVTRWGVTPAYVLNDPTPHELLTLLTAMFLHGSLAHLVGNLAFLWFFGRSVERTLGHARFLALYVGCGVVAALVEAAVAPGSILPIVGASGAVAGVLGAHVALWPRLSVYPILWLALQGVAAVTSPGVDVAWYAHVGGFVAGMGLGAIRRGGAGCGLRAAGC